MDTISATLVAVIDSIATVVMNDKIESDTRVVSNADYTGSLVIILIFIAERVLNFFANRYSRRSQYFLEMIIKPHLDKINALFTSVAEQVIKDSKELKATTGNVHILKLEKIKKLGLVKDNIVDFDHQFLTYVRAVDKSKAARLTQIILQLDDLATKSYDKSTIDSIKFKRKIHEFKSEFIRILHKRF